MCSSTSEAITRSNVAVGEGQRQRVALHRRRRVAVGQLARFHHGTEGAPHLSHLVGTGVERHDRRPTAGRLERVPSETAPEVEHQVPAADAEPLVVDGQHQAAPRGTAGSEFPESADGAPGRGLPSRWAR